MILRIRLEFTGGPTPLLAKHVNWPSSERVTLEIVRLE